MPGTVKQEIESFKQTETTKLDSEVQVNNGSTELLTKDKEKVSTWSGETEMALGNYKKVHDGLDKRRRAIAQASATKLKVLADELEDVKPIQDRINNFVQTLTAKTTEVETLQQAKDAAEALQAQAQKTLHEKKDGWDKLRQFTAETQGRITEMETLEKQIDTDQMEKHYFKAYLLALELGNKLNETKIVPVEDYGQQLLTGLRDLNAALADARDKQINLDKVVAGYKRAEREMAALKNNRLDKLVASLPDETQPTT